MKRFAEELGHDNEWGRPELTKKMLDATPGQRIEVVYPVDQEVNFPLKAEFLKRLRAESFEPNQTLMLSEGVLKHVTGMIQKAVEYNAKMSTQQGHYDAWKKSEDFKRHKTELEQRKRNKQK